MFAILLFGYFNAQAQEHRDDTPSSPKYIYFISDDNTSLYYDSSDTLVFDVYTVMKVDVSYYPLFLTFVAQSENEKITTFRYPVKEGNLKPDELKAAIGKKTVVRSRRYAGELVAFKISIID